MEKLTGLKKVKIAVFISGTGSNLKNLIKQLLNVKNVQDQSILSRKFPRKKESKIKMKIIGENL